MKKILYGLLFFVVVGCGKRTVFNIEKPKVDETTIKAQDVEFGTSSTQNEPEEKAVATPPPSTFPTFPTGENTGKNTGENTGETTSAPEPTPTPFLTPTPLGQVETAACRIDILLPASKRVNYGSKITGRIIFERTGDIVPQLSGKTTLSFDGVKDIPLQPQSGLLSWEFADFSPHDIPSSNPSTTKTLRATIPLSNYTGDEITCETTIQVFPQATTPVSCEFIDPITNTPLTGDFQLSKYTNGSYTNFTSKLFKDLFYVRVLGTSDKPTIRARYTSNIHGDPVYFEFPEGAVVSRTHNDWDLTLWNTDLNTTRVVTVDLPGKTGACEMNLIGRTYSH